MTKLYKVQKQVIMSGGIYDKKKIADVSAKSPKEAIMKAINKYYSEPKKAIGRVFYVDKKEYIIIWTGDKLKCVWFEYPLISYSKSGGEYFMVSKKDGGKKRVYIIGNTKSRR